MRIVHVIGHYIPRLGYEENCLPEAQAKAGNEVVLVTSNRLPPDFAQFSQQEKDSASDNDSPESGQGMVEVIRLPSTPSVSGIIVLNGLGRTLRNLSPDVVHVHGALSLCAIQCLLYQKRTRYGLIVDDHSHSRNVHIDTAYKRAYVRAAITAYRICDRSVGAFVPVTPAASVFLETQLGISRSRIRQGALGADPRVFMPSSSDRANCRMDLGLSPDDVLIVTTGKFSENKNLETLVQSFAQVSARHDHARLMLAGSGQSGFMNQLTRQIVDLDLAERVTVRRLIPHDALARFYNGADIGVWPGAHTITVLEAMSTGLPCVLPIEELGYKSVVESGACMGFKSDQINSLTASIEALIVSPELRTKLSARARELIEQSLSWDRIARDLTDVYRATLSR
ncbi:hypothetical protein AUG19_08745 [archaeon 13_1_20CM_2_54_9]|nr:MAG: hypothetical protein AUG19_08745 [archaeon 13_1_20CM_2_54_9]